MQKEEIVIESAPVNKGFNWKILIAIIIILLLIAILTLISLSIYNYLTAPKDETNVTDTNTTQNITPVNPINNTTPPVTQAKPNCTDGKKNGNETGIDCGGSCKRCPTGPGSSDPTCNPDCAGKSCGSNGCSGSCGACSFGYACNSTFGCSLIDCTNDTGCSSEGLFCSGAMPYNCSKTIDEDICLERVNSTICSSGYQCINGTGCSEIIDCTSNLNCSSLVSDCSYGICNSTNKCEIRYNQTTNLCRVASGACGAAEYCSGSSSACPSDSNSTGNVCRASTGICDITDKCSGASSSCPTDLFNSTSTLCRASVFDCDAAEMCSGSGASCPANLNKTDGTACTGGTCQLGKCIGCMPQCSGKQCGNDGCSGSCGTCGTGKVCNATGQCIVSTNPTTSSITQYGITWTFDKEYTYGQFANGDYWVVGPVTITKITPDAADGMNGWMVNILDNSKEAFDFRYNFAPYANYYDSSLMPSLPYLASGNKSIIKAKSVPYVKGDFSDCELWNKICVLDASILTVLDHIPPQDSFRPSYIGTNKEFFYANSVHTELLHSYLPVSNMPSKDSILQRVGMSRLDYASSSVSQGIFNPYNSVYPPGRSWGSEIAVSDSEVLFWLALNSSLNDKLPVVYKYIQEGIDLYAARKYLGTDWVMGGGGNGQGRLITMVFATTMLNSSVMKTTLFSSTVDQEYSNTFWESEMYKQSFNNQTVLWGMHGIYGNYEDNYWNAVVNEMTDRTARDPYGYIDGINTYQVLTALPTKYQALVLILYPEMLKSWPEKEAKIIRYADRWTAHGRWMQPDPCAPLSQGGGKDPAHPGQCILDPDLTPGSTFTSFSCQAGKQCGRFPQENGNYKNSDGIGGAERRSAFGEEMWNTYRHCFNKIQDGGEAGVDCGGSCKACGATAQLPIYQESKSSKGFLDWLKDIFSRIF